MKARPILFSGPMVRALIEGRKTQTRRVITLPEKRVTKQYGAVDVRNVNYWSPPSGISQEGWANPGVNYHTYDPSSGEMIGNHIDPCPYGQPGGLLWVRETWTCYRQTSYEYDEHEQVTGKKDREHYAGTLSPVFRADNKNFPDRWEPAIHMPRWASRLTLQITDVRVQRLQDISELDARNEGVIFEDDPDEESDFGYHFGIDDGTLGGSPKEAFSILWRHINGESSWDENPWIWALTFAAHHCNVDQFLKDKAA